MKTLSTVKVFAAILCLLVVCVQANTTPFPSDFVFGVATAAYQIEGAYKEDGRGLSIWDTFSHIPGKTYNGDTGDVACDHYHRLDQDIKLMQDLGIKNYRMSISWSRILPNGTKEYVNQKGIDHYNREIDALRAAGIEVFVTLYHWDLPQVLHDRFGGWLNKTEVVKAFVDYADVCFASFGDRVKHWITLNEPWVVSWLGYGAGVNAPGRCTGCKPGGGNSSTEPYIVTHSQLVAHAAVVDLYRKKYQRTQQGVIGITFNSDWNMPQNPDSKEDIEAAERYQQFQLGWFADPVVFGDYPKIMRDTVGSRLPQFTSEEQALLKKSYDFLGLNHYTSRYVTPLKAKTAANSDWSTDHGCNVTIYNMNNEPIGPRAASDWLYYYPAGIRGILNWMKKRYDAPIYITENGCDDEDGQPIEQALNDSFRTNYIKTYLEQALLAINVDNVNLRGYFVWSLMDNFEWAAGYSKRFGIHYVDYKTLTRYPKRSALWYSSFINS